MQDLRVLAQSFLDALMAGNFADAAARFDSHMQVAVPLVVLSNTWRRLQVKVGLLRSADRVVETVHPSHPQYRILLVQCVFDRGTYTMRLWFNGEGQISGMSIDQMDAALGATH